MFISSYAWIQRSCVEILNQKAILISNFLTIKDAICDFSPKTHESHKKPWRSLSNASIWRGVCQETRLGNPSLNLTCKKFAFHGRYLPFTLQKFKQRPLVSNDS